MNAKNNNLAALAPAELKAYRAKLVTMRIVLVTKASAIEKVLSRVAARLDKHFGMAA